MSIEVSGRAVPPDNYIVAPGDADTAADQNSWREYLQLVLNHTSHKALRALRVPGTNNPPGSLSELQTTLGIVPTGGVTSVSSNTQVDTAWNGYLIEASPTADIAITCQPLDQYPEGFTFWVAHTGVPEQDGTEHNVTISGAPNELFNFTPNGIVTLDHQGQLFRISKVNNNWLIGGYTGISGQAPVYKSDDHLTNNPQELANFFSAVQHSQAFLGWAENINSQLVGRRISIPNMAAAMLEPTIIARLPVPDQTNTQISTSQITAPNTKYAMVDVKLRVRNQAFGYRPDDFVDFVMEYRQGTWPSDVVSYTNPQLSLGQPNAGGYSIGFIGRPKVINRATQTLVDATNTEFEIVLIARRYSSNEGNFA